MAKATVLAFFKKLQEDESLYSQLEALRRRDMRTFLRFAADAGYLFNSKDYRAALDDTYGELPEPIRETLASGRVVIPDVWPAGERTD